MAQDHHAPLGQGELGQGPDDLVASVDGVGVARHRPQGRQVHGGEHLPAGAAPAVDPQVHQYLAGIGPGIGAAGAFPGPVGAFERGLHQVLGVVPVAGQQQRDPEKVRPDVGHERLELLVSAAGRPDLDARVGAALTGSAFTADRLACSYPPPREQPAGWLSPPS